MQDIIIIYPTFGFITIGAALLFVGQMVLYSAASLAVGYAVNIALSRDPESPAGKAATLENFDIPTSEQGRAIQVIVGSPRIKGFNDLWHGDLAAVAITEKVKKNAFGNHKNVTVGYQYHLGLHYGWCAFAEELLQLRMGDEVLFDGSGGGPTSNETISINKPNLFGGEKSQGGFVGNIAIMFGGASQSVNSYLSSRLGEGGSQPVPAFRGIVSTVAEQPLIGTTTSIKRMDAIFRRTESTNRGETIWYDSKAEINDSSGVPGMNIAHIVHEIIVDPDYSLGFTSGFNDANFKVAADTLYTEGYGLSFVLDVAKNGEKMIQEVMSYANGFLLVNPATNEFEIKLLRDDFNIVDLDIIDDSIITEIKKVSRDSSTEVFNQVSISFTDPVSRETATMTAQNTALIEASGVVVNKDISAPAVHSPELANKIASNALQSIAVNPFRMTIIGKRELAQYNRGDPVRLQMPEDGFADVVVRVIDANYGTLKDGIVELKVAQDVFRAGEAIFSDPDESLWEDTAELPSELVYKSIIELPYYNLARDVLGASVAAELATTTGRPIISGIKTKPNNTTYDTWSKLSTDSDYALNTEDAIFCGFCKTSGSISAGITQITIGYTDDVDLQIVEIDEATWCQIDNEILKVIDINTGTFQLTLERGCLDTVPADHSSGAEVFFVSAAYSTSNNEYSDGQTVDIKILPETTLGQLELGDVTKDSLTMDKRYIRPYNGANFAGAASGQDIDFTWEHRNRVTQVQDITLQSETGITPEAGTTYTFTAYDNTVQVRQVTGIAGDSYAYLEADLISDFGSVANAKLATSTYELISVRNTYQSWQNWDIDGTTIS